MVFVTLLVYRLHNQRDYRLLNIRFSMAAHLNLSVEKQNYLLLKLFGLCV
jgi:hypothetical protein